MMQALGRQNDGKGWGAGELLNDYTARLATRASGQKV
jgi:carnitine 3-dehydrogenase